MSQNIELLITKQQEIVSSMEKIQINFKKDSQSRKTREYLQERLNKLELMFESFLSVHNEIIATGQLNLPYFEDGQYGKMKQWYENFKNVLQTCVPYQAPGPSTQVSDETAPSKTAQSSEIHPGAEVGEQIIMSERIRDLCYEVDGSLWRYKRVITRLSIEFDLMEAKWELDEALLNLKTCWDGLEKSFSKLVSAAPKQAQKLISDFDINEKEFYLWHKKIGSKLSSNISQQQITPKVEIPLFYGSYSNWNSFYELYRDTIHSNTALTASQKMQFLKAKIKGEAEKLISHLSITTENYSVALKILQNRFDNKRLIFNELMTTLMSQQKMSYSNSEQLKRFHDTNEECVNAIKNLGINTDYWDEILVFLLSQKLDADTTANYIQNLEDPKQLQSFSSFQNYLESRFQSLEASFSTQKMNSGAGSKSIPKSNWQQQKFHSSKKSDFTTHLRHKEQTFHATNSNEKNLVPKKVLKCMYCFENHKLYVCQAFKQLNTLEKINFVEKNGLCKVCFVNHPGNCKMINKLKCKKCNSVSHHELLHVTTTGHDIEGISTVVSNTAAQVNGQVLIPTALIKIKSQNGEYIILRCLCDQGSQCNFITSDAAQRLGLQRNHCKATVSGVGGENPLIAKGMVQLQCTSLDSEYSFGVEALILTKLTQKLPTYSSDNSSWSHLRSLVLADPTFNKPGKIDLIIGADIYSDIILDNVIRGIKGSPIAQQSKLGWLVSGGVGVNRTQCFVAIQNIDQLEKYWEIENISSTNIDKNEFCENLFQTSSVRRNDGRYVVRLPIRETDENYLGDSRPRALACLKQTEKRFKNDRSLQDAYRQFMREYLQLGHMVPCEAHEKVLCYLSHHGVLRPDSTTTKLRVVFNASLPTSSGRSLNDCMEAGPNLQKDLHELLLRFRSNKYAMVCDAEKMFRQVIVSPEHQLYQVILWRENVNEPIKSYKLSTLSYGTNCAPYLSQRVLKQIAQDERFNFPLATEIVENDVYMDDFLTGSNDINHAKQLKNQLVGMLKSGGFILRKWASNEPQLLDSQQYENNIQIDLMHNDVSKTLGVYWNTQNDTFLFKINIVNDKSNVFCISKRQLLSEISKIFDPLGLLSPVTVTLKILFQRVWSENLKWDDNVSKDISDDWFKIKSSLVRLEQVSIGRWIGSTHNNIKLLAYCDFSKKAYACVFYVHSNTDNSLHLFTAKTKIAPLKIVLTVPRGELCGALLLVKLFVKIRNSLRNDNVTCEAFSDSKVVLHWIQTCDVNKLPIFVATRVKQIRDILPGSNWNYISTANNPADVASRGLSPDKLLDCKLWWEGPTNYCDVLQQVSNEVCNVCALESYVQNNELSQPLQCYVTDKTPDLAIVNLILCKQSSLDRALRVLSYVFRFVNRSIEKPTFVTFNEKKRMLILFIKFVQYSNFKDEIEALTKKLPLSKTSRILSLDGFLDQDGLLRVGGRLRNSYMDINAKHPYILPSNDRLTELVIRDAHEKTLHGGVMLTLARTRHRFWVIGGNRVVKKILRNCVTCHRYKAHRDDGHQKMADLPDARITPSPPFSVTGVDFMGPIEITLSRARGARVYKGYVAVFVCFSTKAVHIEPVSDLTSSAFIMALKRMVARRGLPKVIYSDNGKNFVATNRILGSELKTFKILFNSLPLDAALKSFLEEAGIEWKFITPLYPNAGGLWESAVKVVKHHFKKIVGSQKLSFEEIAIFLAQIESCLNSRPLTPLSEDIECLDCLTPAHFLVGRPLTALSHCGTEYSDLRIRWRLVEAMYHGFWKKWSNEYLTLLQQRSKWRTSKVNICPDQLVLLKEDIIPPQKWLMGRVLEVYPGKDNITRSVSIKTKNGVLKRPVHKLSPLPIEPVVAATVQAESNSKNIRNKVNHNSISLLSLISISLLLFFNMCSVGYAQQTKFVKIQKFQTSPGIYFENIGQMYNIHDEWKLLIYYNLSTYWNSIDGINNYIHNLEVLSQSNTYDSLPYEGLINQLKQDYQELIYKNDLLYVQHGHNSRPRRGLFNVVGSISRSLFGILDNDFADKYEEDIDRLSSRDEYLLELYKSQTSVVEGELNVLSRHEVALNNQMIFMKNITYRIAVLQSAVQKSIDTYSLYQCFTTLAMSVALLLSNLHRVQDYLRDMITDLHQGHLDPNVFTPRQLKIQLSNIIPQLSNDLRLPIDNLELDIQQLYKIIGVKTKITNKNMLFELTIPLRNHEFFQLYQLYNIPLAINGSFYTVKSNLEFCAINMKKDIYIELSKNELTSDCIKLESTKTTYLCYKSHKVFNSRSTTCETQLFYDVAEPRHCRLTLNQTPKNIWLPLQRTNAWIFDCMETCSPKIICEKDDVENIELRSSGIIQLKEGCVLKEGGFDIYSHNKITKTITVDAPIEQLPNVNFSLKQWALPEALLKQKIMNSSSDSLTKLKKDIQQLKNSEVHIPDFDNHHYHHYAMTYVTVTAIIALAVFIIFKFKKIRGNIKEEEFEMQPITSPPRPEPLPRTYSNYALQLPEDE